MISLDLEDHLENRIKYWEKLEALKHLLLDEFLPEAVFAETYFLENGKEISRIYVKLDERVSIHNKDTWRAVMEFFNLTMNDFENFFMEYRDFMES